MRSDEKKKKPVNHVKIRDGEEYAKCLIFCPHYVFFFFFVIQAFQRGYFAATE